MASKLTPQVSHRDHIQGPDTASVTLVEYGDYECPYCGEAFPIVNAIQKRLGKRLREATRSFLRRIADARAAVQAGDDDDVPGEADVTPQGIETLMARQPDDLQRTRGACWIARGVLHDAALAAVAGATRAIGDDGLRRVRTPSAARRSFNSSVESASVMPSSARILATPPISASVFLASSDASSLTKRQSGTIEEKILTCLTCPHIIT